MSAHEERDAARGSAVAPWLPLCLLLLLSVTLSPFRAGCFSDWPALSAPAPGDLFQNLLLFAPLGIATRRISLWIVVFLAAALSTGIEFAQQWLPRDPSVWDVIMNTLGVTLGHRVRFCTGRSLAPAVISRGIPLLAGALLAATVATIPWMRATDFSNWEAYPLLIGNEATGDRPWRGALREVAIYDRVLDSDEAPRSGGAVSPWHEGGPIVWMSFAPPRAARTDGPLGPAPFSVEPPPSASLEAAGLRTTGPGWELPGEVASHVRDRLVETGQIGLWLRVQPDDLSAEGTARILSLSRDTGNRNFTLAQRRRDILFAVRTPATGENGMRPHAATTEGPLTRGEHRVLATFDGVTSRIYLDGRCIGETLIAFSRGTGFLGLELSAALVSCTALTALAFALATPRASPLVRRGTYLLGGLAAWFLLLVAGAWSHVPGFATTAVALGVAALACGWPLAGTQRSSTSERIT
jgi:hypothetical protein